MRVSPTKGASRELLEVFNKAVNEYSISQRGDSGRLYNLRCSQIPYCPAAVLLNWGKNKNMQSTELMSAYYFAVGHAVHAVMQKYLPQSGQFLADYECKECDTKYPMSQQYECCGFPTQYEEVLISVGGKKGKFGIVGHIDAIFVTKDKKYWILDFKTCSVTNAKNKVRNPSAEYSAQVRAYAYLLRKQYGIVVSGVMLMYLPRDNPRKPQIWEEPIKPDFWEKTRVRLKHWKGLHKKTMYADNLKDILELSKNRCGGQYCEACKKTPAQLKGLFTKLLPNYPIIKE